MFICNIQRMVKMLTRMRIFMAKLIAQAAFISVNFNAL